MTAKGDKSNTRPAPGGCVLAHKPDNTTRIVAVLRLLRFGDPRPTFARHKKPLSVALLASAARETPQRDARQTTRPVDRRRYRTP